MHPLITKLEEYGLYTEEMVVKATSGGWSVTKLRGLAEELRALLLDEAVKQGEKKITFDLFSMLASSSFRGDSGCKNWECRLNKVGTLGRYASLYCDKLIVPISFHAGCHLQDDAWFQYVFGGTLLCLLELRPVIESRIVLPVADEVHLCEKHWRVTVPAFDLIQRIANDIYLANVDRFSVTFHKTRIPGRFGKLHIEGPVEFLEHGQIFRMLDAAPEWLPDAGDVQSLMLPAEMIRSSGIAKAFFESIAYDIMIQQYYGYKFGSCFLTDLSGETKFLDKLNENYIPASVTKLCEQLTHTIPLLAELPIPTILRIRREEPEAFIKYRNTVNEIAETFIRSGKELTDNEIRELVNDQFRRPVQELVVEAESKKKKLAAGMLKRAAIPSALVALGIYGGIFPPHLRELIQALGAYSLVKDAASSMVELTGSDNELKGNNFYFLLKLMHEQSS